MHICITQPQGVNLWCAEIIFDCANKGNDELWVSPCPVIFIFVTLKHTDIIIISQCWDDTGTWNPPSWKTRATWSYILNTKQGCWWSGDANSILTHISCKWPVLSDWCLCLINSMMIWNHFDNLVQERRNPIAHALELRLSCTDPSILFGSGHETGTVLLPGFAISW